MLNYEPINCMYHNQTSIAPKSSLNFSKMVVSLKRADSKNAQKFALARSII